METVQNTTPRAGVQLPPAIRAPVTAEVPSRRLEAAAMPMADELATLRDEFSEFRTPGIEILCHAIDLAQEPKELLAQMQDLAERIASAGLGDEALASSLQDA